MTRTARAAWLGFVLCAGCGDDAASGSSASTEDPALRTVGRADASDPAAVRFAWSGSGFVAVAVVMVSFLSASSRNRCWRAFMVEAYLWLIL